MSTTKYLCFYFLVYLFGFHLSNGFNINSVLFLNYWTEITEFSIFILLMGSKPLLFNLQILKKIILKFVVSSFWLIKLFILPKKKQISQKKIGIHSFGDSSFWNWLFASRQSACVQKFMKKNIPQRSGLKNIYLLKTNQNPTLKGLSLHGGTRA